MNIKATDIGTGGAVLSHAHHFEQYGDHAPDDYGDPLVEWCPGCSRLRSDIPPRPRRAGGKAEQITRIAAALSDELSAMTEGGEETMALEPSDEPGSPYVNELAERLYATGLRIAPDDLDVERLARAIESLAHGRCCWEAADDARDLATEYARLSPAESPR